MMFRRWFVGLLIFLLMAAGLSSCTSSLHLANRFVVDDSDIHVLVMPPPNIIKTFLPAHPDSLSAEDMAETDETKIRFVNQVEDSLFISVFLTSLKQHLERFSIRVYGIEDMDAFFRLDEKAYVFMIAQMELLEYVEEELFVARDGNINYVRREPVTVLENNVWFEFMKLHDADFGMEVLFSVHATSDFVEGRFVRRANGEVLFDANRYLLTNDDLIALAQFAGEQNARNIFDHLMNLYVRENLGREPSAYYSYDVDQHAIRQTDQPGFIIIIPVADDPETTPGLEETSDEAPGETPGEAPGEKSGEAPGETPGEAPGEKSGEAPGETPGEAPGEKSGEAPGETPGEAPGETSGELPSKHEVNPDNG